MACSFEQDGGVKPLPHRERTMSVSALPHGQTTDRTKKGKTLSRKQDERPFDPSKLKLPRSGLVQLLNHSHGRGRRISVSLGVIFPANFADAPVSDNPISFLIDIRARHNKQKIEDLQTNPACFSTNTITSHNRENLVACSVRVRYNSIAVTVVGAGFY